MEATSADFVSTSSFSSVSTVVTQLVVVCNKYDIRKANLFVHCSGGKMIVFIKIKLYIFFLVNENICLICVFSISVLEIFEHFSKVFQAF